MIESIYEAFFLDYCQAETQNIFAEINAEESKLSLNGVSHDRQGKTGPKRPKVQRTDDRKSEGQTA
jgi:hypothetical protein